jgi:hypothetical protein
MVIKSPYAESFHLDKSQRTFGFAVQKEKIKSSFDWLLVKSGIGWMNFGWIIQQSNKIDGSL